MHTLKISLANGVTRVVPVGTPVGQLIESGDSSETLPFIAAIVNNDVASLSYPLPVNAEVKFITMADPRGWRIYRNSLCFLLARVVREFFSECDFSVEHSFGNGIFCAFRRAENGCSVSRERIEALQCSLDALIEADEPIERQKLAYAEAVAHFEARGPADKARLLRFLNPPHIVLHRCGEFTDIAHGPLASRTSVLRGSRLIPHEGGFVLQFPERENPHRTAPFEDQPHLFRIFKEHKEWGRILHVSTVGELNEQIDSGNVSEFIRIAEALHEKKLTAIATSISERRDTVRVVLVAGPSSAGKTTFSKRLADHLRVVGLTPLTLGTDDYFVGAERNPLDEDGQPDYEHIEAVDIDLFNAHLNALIAGESIEPPRFNFSAKCREPSGRQLFIGSDRILIVEGIHGLNPLLTRAVKPEHTYRIYISALTQLSLDANNRISTTDNRLMRRMVRDARFRGHSPLRTLQLWPSVRRGEKRWVFPFQREADATFNSALDYELAVLKPLVEPLLRQVKSYHAEYAEARRLSEFLLNFLPAPSRNVPFNSILREYIGGSAYSY